MRIANRNISVFTVQKSYSGWIAFMIHLLVLTLLFMLPEIIITITSPDVPRIPPGIYLKVAVFISVFYLNYYLIIGRTLLPRPRFLRFFLCNVALAAIAMLLIFAIWHYLDPAGKMTPPEACRTATGAPAFNLTPDTVPPPPHGKPDMPPHRDAPSAFVLSRDFIMIVLTIALAVAMRLNSIWLAAARDRREMEILRKDAELVRLRNQLNPHFLFNTLNSIYALIDIDPAKAQNAIHRLSKMLRYMLYESRDTVTVGHECAFLSDYIELMKLRLPADFPLTVSIDSSSDPMLRLHPLLFINIIENAFKFGMRASGQRMIEIRLSVTGSVVSCRCSNRYTPCSDKTASSETDPSSGIGLENLRRRLQLRYPSAHTLEITNDGSLFTVILSVDTAHAAIIPTTTNTPPQS